MATLVFDVTEATFQRDVMDRSKQVPVVVDFWASWCAPCKALSPLLERLAAEDGGAWVLAKVDVDANPALAQAFGVQGIPAVKAIKDGQLVAEFTGVQPEPELRSWLAQLGPDPLDDELERARALEDAGDADAALAAYRQILGQRPNDTEAKAGMSRLETSQRVAGLDEDALRGRVEADPTDVEAAIGLGDLRMARGEAEKAFDVLLTAIERTSDDERERARAHLVSLLDQLEPSDPRAMAARRRLSSALF